MKVWVAKYALTRGIYEAEVTPKGDRDYENFGKINMISHARGKDSFEEKRGAIARAKQLLERKIKSLENQVKHLKGIKFE